MQQWSGPCCCWLSSSDYATIRLTKGGGGDRGAVCSLTRLVRTESYHWHNTTSGSSYASLHVAVAAVQAKENNHARFLESSHIHATHASLCSHLHNYIHMNPLPLLPRSLDTRNHPLLPLFNLHPDETSTDNRETAINQHGTVPALPELRQISISLSSLSSSFFLSLSDCGCACPFTLTVYTSIYPRVLCVRVCMSASYRYLHSQLLTIVHFRRLTCCRFSCSSLVVLVACLVKTRVRER